VEVVIAIFYGQMLELWNLGIVWDIYMEEVFM